MIASCLLLAPFFAPPDVLVVDSNGLGDASTIQAAVDLARDGDTVLVRRSPRPDVECCYPPFTVDGKSLSIHGIGPGQHYTGAVTVQNIPSGGAVTLSGLDIYWPHASTQDPLSSPGIILRDCDGPLRLQNLRASGFEVETYFGIPPSTALYIEGCNDVVLRNCTLVGTAGEIGYGSRGSAGVRAVDSNLAIYGCEISGGLGGSDTYIQSGIGLDGGDGLNLNGGTLFARGSRFVGGKGGPGVLPDGAADGGAGLRVLPGGTAALVECTLQGGPGGGLFGSSSTEEGAPGPDSSGDVTTDDLPRVRFDAPTLTLDEASARVQFEGPPGQTALLLVSPSTRSSDLGAPTGVLHAQPLPQGRMPQGTIPPSGLLEVDHPLPAVQPGESARSYLQGGFEASDGTVRLADLVVVETLGDGFDQDCGIRIHVDAAAGDGGDGTSWASAYNDLAFALAVAPDCSGNPAEIWIAEGVYTPVEDSFFVHSNTHIYGGFRGDEASLDERDLSSAETVLDGAGTLFTGLQIGSPSFFQDADPMDYVEGAVEGVRVDGIVIRGARFFGAAVVGEARFVHCRFEDNVTRGIGSPGGELGFYQCSFTGNGSLGLELSSSSSFPCQVLVVQSVFAFNDGGAVMARGRGGPMDVALSSCTVVGNGGIGGVRIEYDLEPASLAVQNSILWGNSGAVGGLPSQIDLMPFSGMASIDLSVNHSCLEGWDGSLGGLGNLGADPGLGEPTTLAGLVLPRRSPCVDSGSNLALPADAADLDRDGDVAEPLPVDFRGRARIQDVVWHPGQPRDPEPTVDMGAFETQRLPSRGIEDSR